MNHQEIIEALEDMMTYVDGNIAKNVKVEYYTQKKIELQDLIDDQKRKYSNI